VLRLGLVWIARLAGGIRHRPNMGGVAAGEKGNRRARPRLKPPAELDFEKEGRMARRGLVGGAADAVKTVAGGALGAAAPAATTAVIEAVAKSMTKNDRKLDEAMPLIEDAVKARVSKP